MATTNGALAFLVRALAVEIAPVRVNAVFYAIDNPYVTGTVLHVDGGGRLA
ncbi:hypothetical protein [Sphaerisporangium fuscum]|uniref:hypothetical protein n=1 Tax=Sphaerisporangium fuscum TaxID=2835868 RepID=UPI001BDDA0B1|nr:hypothetical protein [Sphaerisporangium fuscum]